MQFHMRTAKRGERAKHVVQGPLPAGVGESSRGLCGALLRGWIHGFWPDADLTCPDCAERAAELRRTERRKFIRFPAELGGRVRDPEQSMDWLDGALADWIAGAKPGDKIELACVEMTMQDFEKQ